MRGFEPPELGPEHDQQLHGRRARHGGGAPSFSENRDLAKEVARPECREALAVGRDGRGSFDENEERLAVGAFAHEPHAVTRVLHVEPGRELG